MTARLAATRRELLAGGLAALVTPLLGPAAQAAAAACGTARTLSPTPQRAVSLRRLSEALLGFGPADKRYAGLNRFNGMTRLDGYVTDAANRDVILWGIVEKGAPPLELQDFVIAMRNAHGRYVTKRDGKTYLMAPAISIDPDPEVYRKLRALDSSVPLAKLRSQHAAICASPQKVRIEGMPRGCRAAKVLVEADYRMKQVGQGTVKLPIKAPFPAVYEARWKHDIEAMRAGKTVKGTNTRYWFEPGRFSYKVSPEDDTVFLDTAQIVLRDEDQRLKPGKLEASGAVDPFSRAFACSWSERMEDTYRAEPIWRDMHNIFRHFAIARILADRNELRSVRFTGEVLLDRYEMPEVRVPDTLPGLGQVNEVKFKELRSTQRFTNWVCGGVSLGFDGETLKREPDDGRAGASGAAVLAARPDPAAVSWPVNGDVGPAAPQPGSPLKDILKKFSKDT